MRNARKTRRVALLVGASRGIGKAAALRLAGEGWDLALVSRTGGPKLERAAADCRKRGAKVLAVKADLAAEGEAEALVAQTLRAHGRLDALVHAAGDYEESSLRAQSFEGWERLFRSNLDSAFLAARAALAPMRKRKWGRIVFFGMAGISGLRARRSCAAYAAAKTALLVYARSLALEEARNGITVNVVSPGVIPHEGSHPTARNRRLWKSIPAGRPGTPEDVAAAVAFLLSEDAGYVTGADLPVSGGWMA